MVCRKRAQLLSAMQSHPGELMIVMLANRKPAEA